MEVILADDQDDVRSALRLILEDEPGLRVAWEARRADELLSAVAEMDAGVVILDWELPGLRAADLSRLLDARRPRLKVIALSGWPEARRAAVGAGADGFVSKCDPPEELLRVVRAVCGRAGCG
jgi:DNA-binding NarL/FixJ family response regulator